MLNPFTRSVPSRRMSVRTAKVFTQKSAAHKSFRLSKPDKAKFIQSGFGSYTPESFKQTLKQADPKQASSKEEAFFLKHAKSEKTLTSRSDIEKFSEGFFEEAHDTGTKLRTGLNIRRSGSEQAKRFVKEYEKKTSTPDAAKTSKMQEQREHHKKMTSMRDRLGIQHGRGQVSTPNAVQEPTPLAGSGWSGPDKAVSATSASPSHTEGGGSVLGLQNASFLGGRISTLGDRPAPAFGAAAASAPAGPVIRTPKDGASVALPLAITIFAGAGHTLKLHLDGQLEATAEVPTSPDLRAEVSMSIATGLSSGDHELMVAEYQGQIPIGVSQPVRIRVVMEPTPLAAPKNDLPDMSQIHELPI